LDIRQTPWLLVISSKARQQHSIMLAKIIVFSVVALAAFGMFNTSIYLFSQI